MNKIKADKIKKLKAAKEVLESLFFHMQSASGVLYHYLEYSRSLKDCFSLWQLKMELKKLEKRIKTLERLG